MQRQADNKMQLSETFPVHNPHQNHHVVGRHRAHLHLGARGYAPSHLRTWLMSMTPTWHICVPNRRMTTHGQPRDYVPVVRL